MHIGADGQFLTWDIQAGLFYQHQCLFEALTARDGVKVTLFLNEWANPPDVVTKHAPLMQRSFPRCSLRRARVPGRWARVRLPLMRLGRVDVFYHPLGSKFARVPGRPNAFLVPDLIPLFVDYGERLHEEYAAYYRRAVSDGDLIFVYSNHTKLDVVKHLGADPDRIAVMPLAAAPQFMPVQDRDRLRDYLAKLGLDTVPYVLTVGTVEPRKNLEGLVRAFARLKQKHPDLPHKLVVAGAHWLGADALRAVAEQEGIAADFLLLGFVPQLELLYGGASVFAFPSLYEGFGLPPLEAMAAGIPVVASNATSIPEVVGEGGLLVDACDPDEFADALSRVIHDSTLAERLVREGFRRAADFSWEKTADVFQASLRASL